MGEDDRSYYQVLGVEEDAEFDEVRTAFHRLAKSLHPDARRGMSSTEDALADRRMQEVTNAWHVLRDPQQRKLYDRKLARTRERIEAAARRRAEPLDPRITQHEADAADPSLGRYYNGGSTTVDLRKPTEANTRRRFLRRGTRNFRT